MSLSDIQTTPELLAYEFGVCIDDVLKHRHLKGYALLRDTLVGKLIAEVPIPAFAERLAHQEGYLFYTGDVSQEGAVNMQLELMSAHLTLSKDKPLRVHLTSYGGEVLYGYGIMSTIHQIQRMGRVVNIHVTGSCASMATVILQAANHRSAEDFCAFLVHEDSYGMENSKRSAHRDMGKFVDAEEEYGYQIYAQRSGRTKDFWKEMCIRHDTTLTAEEALEYGLIDEILPSPFAPK